MNKTEEKIISIFDKLSTLTEKRLSLEHEADGLKEQEKILNQELQTLIPSGSTKAGIFHNVTKKPSISYAKFYDALLKEVIPKTKAAAAEDLKETFTSSPESHSFKKVT